MRAISLTQPWATLMAIGAKHFETRSWSTPHRGPLAIAAAKKFPAECRSLMQEDPFAEVLEAAGYTRLDHLYGLCGQILCVVDLLECCRVLGTLPALPLAPPAEFEAHFGDYSPGRSAWITNNVRRLVTPVPATGRLGIWEPLDDAVQAINAQLEAMR